MTPPTARSRRASTPGLRARPPPSTPTARTATSATAAPAALQDREICAAAATAAPRRPGAAAAPGPGTGSARRPGASRAGAGASPLSAAAARAATVVVGERPANCPCRERLSKKSLDERRGGSVGVLETGSRSTSTDCIALAAACRCRKLVRAHSDFARAISSQLKLAAQFFFFAARKFNASRGTLCTFVDRGPRRQAVAASRRGAGCSLAAACSLAAGCSLAAEAQPCIAVGRGGRGVPSPPQGGANRHHKGPQLRLRPQLLVGQHGGAALPPTSPARRRAPSPSTVLATRPLDASPS